MVKARSRNGQVGEVHTARQQPGQCAGHPLRGRTIGSVHVSDDDVTGMDSCHGTDDGSPWGSRSCIGIDGEARDGLAHRPGNGRCDVVNVGRPGPEPPRWSTCVLDEPRCGTVDFVEDFLSACRSPNSVCRPLADRERAVPPSVVGQLEEGVLSEVAGQRGVRLDPPQVEEERGRNLQSSQGGEQCRIHAAPPARTTTRVERESDGIGRSRQAADHSRHVQPERLGPGGAEPLENLCLGRQDDRRGAGGRARRR